MSASDALLQDPRGTLFDMLDEVRVGMLGLTAAGEGLQPMTHFPDRKAGLVWFISSNDSDLVKGVGPGEDADFVAISRDQSIHGSLRGKLYHVHDEGRLQELWSPFVAAWFDGRNDPKIALLRFDPETAQIWQSTTSVLRFGFELLRSNLDRQAQPDVGAKATVRFPKTA